MNAQNAYLHLTGVDIEQQKRIWDDRGKGYYGEYLVFCLLYKEIAGHGKILMNLNVPVDSCHSTEIDLALIHETGIYVFEVKHFKGTIYGKDTDPKWTQYFRTTQNQTFRNPMDQNAYHVRALKNLFPDIPIHSFIVFTSQECDIRVQNSNEKVDVCALRDMMYLLKQRIKWNPNKYDLNDLDSIFVKLSPFSPMRHPVTIAGVTADFDSWIQPTIALLSEKKKEVEEERIFLEKTRQSLNKSKKLGLLLNIGIAIACILAVAIAFFHFSAAADAKIAKNDAELNAFKQNFLHVEEIDNEYIDSLASYVEISNVELLPLTDDAVSFSARIAMKNDTYGIAFTENAKYIVMTNSGKVLEFDVFGERLSYNQFGNMIGYGIREYMDLEPLQIYGIVNPEDIRYIKVTGVELIKTTFQRTVIKDNLEIMLFG